MQHVRRVARSKWFPLALFVIFFALPLLLYLSYYLQDLYLFKTDSLVNIAKRDMYVDALAGGEIPLWNKLLGNGVPVADSAFRPFLVLTSFLSSLDYAYVEYALHLAIGATFLYLYLREIGCHGAISVLTALLYELSVHLGGLRKEYNMVIDAVVYLPVILFFLHRYFRTGRFVWLVLSSVSMALQFYDGMIQHTLYTDIAVFFYLLFLGIHHRRKAGRLIGEMAVWGLMYAGLIAPRLLALADTMMQYGENGASAASLDVFQAFSMHWLKLLMMLFPKGAGDIHAAMGNAYSSGVDIEIFCGIAFCFILCVGVARFWKDFYVRLCVGMMVAAFLFAVNAHIPFLSDALYKIPILNGFRVPARSLFLFTFFGYVLFAISLSRLLESEAYKRLARPACLYAAFAVLVCAAALVVWGWENNALSTLLRAHYPTRWAYFVEAFLPGLVVVALLVALCFLLRRGTPRLNRWGQSGLAAVLCAFVTVCTLVEVIPFTLETTPSQAHQEAPVEEAIARVTETIGTRKALEARPSHEKATWSSLVSMNANQMHGFAALNAYMGFNNPNMYKLFTQSQSAPLNASGLYIPFPTIERSLAVQNDLLSMLGVQYVIDSFGLIEEGGMALEKDALPERRALSVPKIDATAGELFVFGENLGSIPAQSTFEVSFTAEATAVPEFLLVDLYANTDYYEPERTIVFPIREGLHTYNMQLTSGDIPETLENVILRVIVQTDEPIAIENFQFTEIGPSDEIIQYDPYFAITPESGFLQHYEIADAVSGAVYEVSFTATAVKGGLPTYFYVDLYGEGYDSLAQDLPFILQSGTHRYKGYLSAGNIPEETGRIDLRIIAHAKLPVEVYGFTAIKVADATRDVYVPFVVNDSVRIFENTNAQEALYVPQHVVSIDDLSGLYTDSLSLDLLSNSYVQGVPDMDLTEANAQVTVDAFGYNSIEGRVVSEQPAYLNFSQNYFEGWQAYVNGVRTPIYLTNGVIQGIEIPAGESTVRFVYVPQLFYAGLVILGVTVVLTGLGLVLEGRRHKKLARQEAAPAA